MTPTVENITTGPNCSFKSLILTWIPPANNKKFNIAPIRTSVKSRLFTSFIKPLVVLGKKLSPEATKITETMMAITIIPIVLGNLRTL